MEFDLLATVRVYVILQISDLHISLFHDLTRISELEEFCNNSLNVIKPSVVLATGKQNWFTCLYTLSPVTMR